MSGWIKFEKDIQTDPRFLRMVRRYISGVDVTQVRISERTAVTHLLGGLINLWGYADTHIREDDTLDLGADEINELVGIEGFAQLMPTDWLEVIDPHRVKLTDFQAHNGTEAKKKALTQKRVERHRIRTVTQGSISPVPSGNAPALPDQTRPDQTKTLPQSARDPAVSPAGEGSTGNTAPAPAAPPSSVDDGFEEFRAAYPGGIYRAADWLAAQHAYGVRVAEGATRQELLAAADAYREQQIAAGNLGSRFILAPSRFLAGGQWRGPFPAGAPETAEQRRARAARVLRDETDARSWERARALATQHGCPLAPREHEGPDAFEGRVKNWISHDKPRASGPQPVTALLAQRSN